MKADEIKKELEGLPHIKTVWVDANGDYYTVAIRGALPLDLTDETVAEKADVKTVEENTTQLPPETATNKRKRK